MNIGVVHIGAGRYSPGYTEHSTFEIWRSLAIGCSSYTVVARSASGQSHTARQGNLDVRLIPSWIESEAEFLLTQLAAVKIARLARPNVIVAQCPALGGLAARFIKAQTGAPILMEFHGSHYFAETGLLSKAAVIQSLTRLCLPHATRIRALSEGMKQKIALHFGAHLSHRIVVVPPRVDLTVFRHSRKHWRLDGRPKAIMVGSVTERKGQVRFLRAVFESGIDMDVWLVGDGPDLAHCMRLAGRYGRERNVKSLGRLTHSELAELLPKADVLVLYSKMEGTPRAIMEGMAAGLPIVSTNAGFVADILNSGKEGFVLGNTPDEEIAKVLENLFADENLRADLARAGRARAEREFAADVVYARYRALIRETAAA